MVRVRVRGERRDEREKMNLKRKLCFGLSFSKENEGK